MKHLSKFNELTSHTYRRASLALNKLGGVHVDRAVKLQDYAADLDRKRREKELLETRNKAKENGTFLLNAEITNSISNYRPAVGPLITQDFIQISRPGTYNNWKNRKNPIDNFQLYKEGPINIYISGLYIDDWLEMELDVEQEISLGLEVIAIGDFCKYAAGIFKIHVGIKWDKSNPTEPSFSITDNVYIGHSWNDDLCLKFADRKSAVKFKNLLKEPKRLIPDENLRVIRELFMTYSTAADMDKYFEMLGKINVNSLYN